MASFYNTHALYLFTFDSLQGHSLLKFDIAMPQDEHEDEDGRCNVSCPQVIHRFYTHPTKVGRIFMGCGTFRSKLVILGGVSRNHDSRQQRRPSHSFPLDVMVFDPAAPSDAPLDKVSLGKLNYPKLKPVVFEVAGKLFVLGSLDHNYYDASTGPHIFEAFDPQTKQWNVLQPPLTKRTSSYYWCFCFVVDSTTVIIKGEDNTLHTFNPMTYEWNKCHLPAFKEDVPFNSLPSPYKDYLYWPLGCSRFMKYGPISDPPQSKEQAITMEWGDSVDTDRFPDDYLSHVRAHLPVISHLGDGRFCLVESSAAYDDDNVPKYFDICFDIYIHKLIHSEKLKAKCVHAASFTLNTGRYWVGPCISYHLIKTSSRKFDGLPNPRKRKF